MQTFFIDNFEQIYPAFPMIFLVIFGIAFLSTIGIFVTVLVIILTRVNKDRKAPRLTVPAKVVDKWTSYSSTHRHRHGHHPMTSTSYHATFEVDSGDRMVLLLTVYEYGLLMEGDQGLLTFQGSRFLDFQRQ